jgi:haloalkane dehalogenase
MTSSTITHQSPFEARTLSLPGGEVSYVDQGAGPVLLFVHAGMWSFIFEPAIERLSVDHRCITLDFPGFGRAVHTTADLGVREQSTVLEQFIDHLDLRNATLVAHDLGGPVGIVAAGHLPDRFSGLILANTFAWTPDTLGLRTMFQIMSSRPMTAFGTATNLVPRLTATSFGVGRHLDSAGRKAFLEPYASRNARRRFHLTMRSAFTDPVFTDEAADLAAGPLNALPVLTIFGEKNDPFGFQRRHAATFPDHEGHIVETGNHFPMMDAPDQFADWIRDWHARKVAPRPGT